MLLYLNMISFNLMNLYILNVFFFFFLFYIYIKIYIRKNIYIFFNIFFNNSYFQFVKLITQYFFLVYLKVGLLIVI